MNSIFNFLKKILKPIYFLFFPYKRPARRYKYLFEIIRETKPRNIMEIGVWNGERGVKMIKLAQKFNPDSISYFGTDLFETMSEKMMEAELSKFPLTKKEVEDKLRETGAKIKLIEGNTLESLPREVESLPKMDLVFIDGGHSVKTIANDWKYMSRLLDDNTVVIFDDYYEDKNDIGAKTVIGDIDKNKYNIAILPIQDVFKKEDGFLKINFVKVTKRNENTN